MSIPLPVQFTEYFESHNQTVVKNMLILGEAIFEAQTTNLNKAKDKVGQITGNRATKPESNYKRLTRFFETQDKRQIVKGLLCVCMCLLSSDEKIKYLALDGTSWEFGDKKIHLLTLSVIYGGVSIPIWWEELDKKGTSNFKERKRVIRNARQYLNLEGLILLADREYLGRDWFKYLKNNRIDFVVRLKAKAYKEQVDEASQRAGLKDYFQKARYIKLERIAEFKRYQRCGVSKRIRIDGQTYTFVIFKNPKSDAKEPLFYYISTLRDKRDVIKAYPVRWKIESCFKHLKSNGFRLEEISLKDPLKIMLMMAIVVFLYVLCVCEGLKQLKKTKPSDWKKFKNGTITLTVSIFRKGLAYVHLKFNNLRTFARYLRRILHDKNLLFLQNVQ
jgi:hypothetical protein